MFAMVFPGQGSQSLGMLTSLYQQYIDVRRTFEEASDILGYGVWSLIEKGPESELNSTVYTQPVMLAADIACYRVWEAIGGAVPQYLAGHSLGEYSALVVAKTLSFSEALRLVRLRGTYMQASCTDGAMAAVLGAEEALIEACCKEIMQKHSGWVVSPANYNSIGQTVIAGNREAVEAAIAALKANGVKRAVLLPVSVPSHCALMQPAAEQLKADFSSFSFQAPSIPVIHNVDVQSHPDVSALQQALLAQIAQPVQWVKTVQFLHTEGIETVVECGPGKVLSGLIKRIEANIQTICIDTPTFLEEAKSLCI